MRDSAPAVLRIDGVTRGAGAAARAVHEDLEQSDSRRRRAPGSNKQGRESNKQGRESVLS